ncbi:MAG TPA: hypothetical protein VMM17_13495 [Gemmatimonadaceae bacterium]|nr:hypothetical protein [Gemmatimonadaceae bacterium]
MALRRYLGFAVLIAVVAIAIIAGLYVLGSPAEQRLRRMDEVRTQELIATSYALDAYWRRNQQLPASLDELLQDRDASAILAGIDVIATQGYKPRGPATYELCASFNRPSSEPGEVPGGPFWSHGEGTQCFVLEVEAADFQPFDTPRQ